MVALKMGIPAVLGTGKSVLNWTKRLQKPEVFFHIGVPRDSRILVF